VDNEFAEEAKNGQASAFKCTKEDRAFQKEMDSFFDEDKQKDGSGDDFSPGILVIEEETDPVLDEESPPLMSEEELLSLTVPVLKVKLRKSGLPVSGKIQSLLKDGYRQLEANNYATSYL